MDHPKKVLVLGATGAMGQYLVPRLASMGYRVDAVALVDPREPVPGVSYLKANVKEPGVLQKLLGNRYDGIVDFMIYSSWELPGRLACFLDHTDHYIYLSSYRIYDNKEHPIRESSPRLIDASENIVLRNSDDYSIYKARGENILRSFSRKNWTIIRPAITYSLMRYQLVTLEAPNTVGRARADRRAALPRSGARRDLHRLHLRTPHLGRDRRLLQGDLQPPVDLGGQGGVHFDSEFRPVQLRRPVAARIRPALRPDHRQFEDPRRHRNDPGGTHAPLRRAGARDLTLPGGCRMAGQRADGFLPRRPEVAGRFTSGGGSRRSARRRSAGSSRCSGRRRRAPSPRCASAAPAPAPESADARARSCRRFLLLRSPCR